jgi:hypothetical protein
MDSSNIDSLDNCVNISKAREDHVYAMRMIGNYPFDELDSGHFGHTLIGDYKLDFIIPHDLKAFLTG